MTERKLLKKKLAKLKQFKNSLPILIDCSEVYGDDYYNKLALERTNKEISEIEEKLKTL